MTETWKDVPGYEGRYQVSDLGRVRSVDRVAHYPAYTRADGIPRSASTRSLRGRILAPGPQRSGHLSVPLGRPAQGKLVHRLVMLAFVGPCPPNREVLHLDHNPTNNCLTNLRYGSRSENLKMDYARGIDRLRGSKRKDAK